MEKFPVSHAEPVGIARHPAIASSNVVARILMLEVEYNRHGSASPSGPNRGAAAARLRTIRISSAPENLETLWRKSKTGVESLNACH